MVNPYAQYGSWHFKHNHHWIFIWFIHHFHFKYLFYLFANDTTVWSGFWSFCWGLYVAGRWSWVWSLQMGYLHYSLMTQRKKQWEVTLDESLSNTYLWWRPIKLPRIVMEGVSFPSLNSVSLSILAYGSLGLGSLGVPSTLAHLPMVLPQPTMLFSTQLWSYRTHSWYI